MTSPINVLWGNIVNSFEQANESSIAMHIQAVDSGNLHREIDYDNGFGAATMAYKILHQIVEGKD